MIFWGWDTQYCFVFVTWAVVLKTCHLVTSQRSRMLCMMNKAVSYKCHLGHFPWWIARMTNHGICTQDWFSHKNSGREYSPLLTQLCWQNGREKLFAVVWSWSGGFQRDSGLLNKRGAPGWLNWLSIQLQLRSWSHHLWVRSPHGALCWQLRPWSLL